ncbi:ROK family protein [Rhizobium beringeri]
MTVRADQAFKATFEAPYYIENDGTSAALGEYVFGGRIPQPDPMFFIHIGHGVGGGQLSTDDRTAVSMETPACPGSVPVRPAAPVRPRPLCHPQRCRLRHPTSSISSGCQTAPKRR